MTIARALDEFRSAAIAKGSEGGPQDAACFDRLVAALRQLESHGSEGRSAFRSLLQDPDANVRSWVAAQLLPTGDPEALAVLEELARGSDILAFNAVMTLSEYSAGSLLPPLG